MTPLELLHPRGFARTAIVIGDGCPARLLPSALPPADGGAADLVVVAMGRHELDVEVGDDAVVCVLQRGHVMRALRRRGFQPAGVMLHLPTLEASTRLVALRGSALTYALSERTSPRGRVASIVSRLPFGRTVLGIASDTSALLCRPDVSPLDWLPSAGVDEVVIDTSWHGRTSTSVVRVIRDGKLVSVTKVGAGPAVFPPGLGEAGALQRLGAAAAAAGVSVPALLDESKLGDAPVTTESALPGRPAPGVISSAPDIALDALERLASWLAQWNETTAGPRELTRDVLQREILQPAADVADDEHLAALRARCEQAEGRTAPAVAVHQDLTMANVLVDGDRLGVVDWASARPDGLPLTDFFYAAVDARAAVDGYANREAAFQACFAPGGDWFGHIERLERSLAARLGIDRELADLAFHACWAQHAANEARRNEEGRQFRALLELAHAVR